MNRIAECCCGQCSIEVNAEPEMYGICHCDNCRKRTGSAFGISAYFNKKHVVNIIGETTTYHLHHAEQNHDQARHFCSTCGTTLYWTISTLPDKIGIAGSCFVQTPLAEPHYSYYDAKRRAWLTVPDALEKY